MKKKLDKIKEISTWISSITIILGFIGLVLGWFDSFFVGQAEIKSALQISQRMALKSIIWNKEVPLVERMSACDDYIRMGYNSYTKKHCELLLRGVEE